jgi:hypothetical protein
MDICSDNRWHWIAVFKDGNLPSVHQELKLLPAGAFERFFGLTVRKTGLFSTVFLFLSSV